MTQKFLTQKSEYILVVFTEVEKNQAREGMTFVRRIHYEKTV